MTYRGYTIAPRTNTAMCGRATVYDILDGDKPVKRGWGRWRWRDTTSMWP